MIQRILSEPEWRDRLTAIDRRGLFMSNSKIPYGLICVSISGVGLGLNPTFVQPGAIARGNGNK